jgi:hypothetical protein
MFPRKPIIDTQPIRYEYDNGKFDEITISNGFEVFLDADHAADQRTRRSLTSIMTLLIGVSVDWKMEQQSRIATCSTDAEMITMYAATKKAIVYKALQQFLQFPQSHKPITMHEDNQPVLDIIAANQVTSRVKHEAIPILFVHEKHNDGTISPRHVSTRLNLADPGTKATPSPLHFRHYNYTFGVRHYPPNSNLADDHYTLADFRSFNGQSVTIASGKLVQDKITTADKSCNLHKNDSS